MSDQREEKLILDSFLPYRLSYLTNIISQRLSDLYSKQYDLTPQEWKVMAHLKWHSDISAAELGEKTVMDKVAISRAVKGLSDKNFVVRIISDQDRRRSILNLTDQGRVIYDQIEPLVITYENRLLDALNEKEKAALNHLMEKLTAHVKSQS